MTKQEINEYLAEQMDGREHYDDGRCNSRDGTSGFCYTGCDRQQYCMNHAPDYTANYQPVLERIVKSETLVIFNVFYHPASGEYVAEFDDVRPNGYRHKARGKNLGEAICLTAVEYLKSREGKE